MRYYRHNPAPLNDLLLTPEESEQLRNAIFSALYSYGVFRVRQDLLIEALTSELSRLPFISPEHLDALSSNKQEVASEVDSSVEFHDVMEDASYLVLDGLLGVGHRPPKIGPDGTHYFGDLGEEPDDSW